MGSAPAFSHRSLAFKVGATEDHREGADDSAVEPVAEYDVPAAALPALWRQRKISRGSDRGQIGSGAAATSRKELAVRLDAPTLAHVVGELEHDALLVRLDAGVDVRLPITHMVSPGL